ncbi:metallophosphoesterase [Methanolobus sp. ZRKC3]|uniref:metallophosphoesterase n=1 Tax=Methanolobus sp. ZRKC3 TaxID=3125786 RepID=UPI003249A3AE
MNKEYFENLNRKVSLIFDSELAVVRKNYDSAILVGDLHGNLKALEFIVKMSAKLKCTKFIFLGDYVDRGGHSVEVLCRLFQLKINHPDNIILLRGNHETAGTNAFYGLYNDLDEDDKIFTLVNRTFENMPIAAVVNGSVFCVHGGIANPICLDLIKKEDYLSYLWNDPNEDYGLKESAQRWGAQEFGPDVCEEFLRINDLEKIVRGHSALDKGYKWWFDGKLLSLFSTPDYCESKNLGAFAFLENGCLEIFVFGRSIEGSYSLIEPTDY